jgi:SagB-type dehydrogenase family enzyme
MRVAQAKYKRSRALVFYWQDGELVFENYALRTRIGTDPLVCSILHFCNDWRSLNEIRMQLGEYKEASVAKVLDLLCRHGALERKGQRRDPRLIAMEKWSPWNPAAGFFHFSTKDAEFAEDQRQAYDELKRQSKSNPMPMPVKKYARASRKKLPWINASSEFPIVLAKRRTWRKFGRQPVSLANLAQTLQLTFSIQSWVDVPELGRAATKTSPSGGGLHPIEAYVLVQHVDGLKRGIYHYDAQTHELQWLRKEVTPSLLKRSLGNQPWFTGAAFFVLMTAVFRRTQWKYDFPRTYRVVLAEAGHLCQTFCLTATWLGLAPFCTMALKDTTWEEWLGIDGVNESILYVAGAGTLPAANDRKNATIMEMGKTAAPR